MIAFYSCNKEKSKPDVVEIENVYKTWLKSSGTMYSNGTLSLYVNQQHFDGKINWSKKKEQHWNDETFYIFPYKFDGKEKIDIGNGILEGSSLVIRAKADNEWEAAIRTSRYKIPSSDNDGNTVYHNLTLYRSLKDEKLNSWKNEVGSLNATTLLVEPGGDNQKIACSEEFYGVYGVVCEGEYGYVAPEFDYCPTCEKKCIVTEVMFRYFVCGVESGGGGGTPPPGTYYPPEEEFITSHTWNQIIISGKKFVLYPQIPCTTLTARAPYTTTNINPTGLTKIANVAYGNSYLYKGGTPGLTTQVYPVSSAFNDSRSIVIDMDYLSVKISDLPYLNGSPTRATATELMTYIRKNLWEFFDPNLAIPEPYNYGNF